MWPRILDYKFPPLLMPIQREHANATTKARRGCGVQLCSYFAPPSLGAKHARNGDEFSLTGGICGSYSKISKV